MLVLDYTVLFGVFLFIENRTKVSGIVSAHGAVGRRFDSMLLSYFFIHI